MSTPGGLDPRNEFRNRLGDQAHDVVDIAEAVVRIRHPADDVFPFQLDEALDREKSR